MITLLRVLFGFIVACLVAGAVTVAFVVTPADIAGLPAEAQAEQLANAGVLSLLAATHSAIFAFPFAMIAIGIAEMSAIRRGSTMRSSALRSRLAASPPSTPTRLAASRHPQRLCTGGLRHRGPRRRSRLLAGGRAPCRRQAGGRSTDRRAAAGRSGPAPQPN